MLFWMRELWVPFQYPLLRQDSAHGISSKLFVDLILPAILSLASLGSSYWLLGKPNYLGNEGLFVAFAPAFQIFAAFFIAALAAVATFNREGLDDPLKGSKIYVMKWSNKKQRNLQHSVTRRQYVCSLFAYLAALSLIFVLFIAVAPIYGPALWSALQVNLHPKFLSAITFIGGFVFFFVIWSVFLLSMVAIKFLADRIQNTENDHL